MENFLEKYNINRSLIDENNIKWDTLRLIYLDFIESKEKLVIYSNLIAELLRKQEKVHTVRSRIKDPEHLIAKLIRKTPERKEKHGADFEFTVENYKEEITDLIGVRVIHIFKEDWVNIHSFIENTWTVKEAQANVREGDNKEKYTDLGIKINSRKTGYRSVHYLVEFIPTNEIITAEIQVRTIFEEGYGEIDHQLSYPNNNVPEVLTLNLLMLNRLAGSADEMASAVKTIKEEWAKMQISLSEKDSELEILKTKIENLDIKKEEKDSLVKDLGKLKLNSSFSDFIFHRLDDEVLKNIATIKNIDPTFLQTLGTISKSTLVDSKLKVAESSSVIVDKIAKDDKVAHQA
ncbi:RelA/SpoT domain-containing protein [Lysinibacillus contaminans]|uniref:RelA/SpoT domain-containing protein n=1 Tax=Lysinibacillus contaminans TaxID=1293441 RepID=UPI000A764D3B|nr:GTP pyrophosphokinase [Lysinibacillus contaminans]